MHIKLLTVLSSNDGQCHNIYKQNHYSPGLNIPIKSSDILKEEKVDYVIILSWNFTNEIIKNVKNINQNIKIIIPFPELSVI